MTRNDSTKKTARLEDNPAYFRNLFVYDLFTTINAIAYENAQVAGQHNELNFYYNITLNNSFKNRLFTLRSYLLNEYSVRYFFDSVTTKGSDVYQVRNTIQFPLLKKVKIQSGITVKSQLWKQFEYREDDSGGTEKYLYTDYFSPGYITYSVGMAFTFLRNASLDIGLAGGKITKIRNQQIFEGRNSKKLYGIERGEKKLVSYGLNIVLNVPPRKISRYFGWENHSSLYASKDQISRIKGYEFDIANVFHYIFLKNLRLSWRLNLRYDEDVSDKVFLMNSFSFGFYLSNKI